MEHNYEFNDQENVILKKLYKHMNFVGYSFLVLGGCKLNSVQNRKFDYGSELFRQFRRKSARTV